MPPLASLRALDVVLREVQLFPTDEDRRRAVTMLGQVGFAERDGEEDSARTTVGVKKLLSMIEMARQEPDATAERLASALMGLGF